MKKIIITSLTMALTLAVMSSCDSKKSSEEAAKTAKDTISWEGTYSTLGDTPGRAFVVELDDDGTYEFWTKEFGQRVAILSNDSIQWNADGNQFTVKDGAGQAYTFALTPEALVYNGDSLRKVDIDDYVGSFSNLYESTYKAEDGSMMEVKLTRNATSLVADIEWGDEEMILSAALDSYSTETLVFTSEDAKLTLDIKGENATLELNGKTEKMILVGLLNEVYTFTPKEGDAVSYDVTFINTDDESYVMIQDKDNAAVILPQTEAWAKGATYVKGDVKFEFNQNEATFSIADLVYSLKKARN